MLGSWASTRPGSEASADYPEAEAFDGHRRETDAAAGKSEHRVTMLRAEEERLKSRIGPLRLDIERLTPK